MTDRDTTQADRLLREAGVNPAPRPAFRPFGNHGGFALFVKGRLRASYHPLGGRDEGLFHVYQWPSTRCEIVEGEENAQALCYEWLEEGDTHR